MNTLTHSCNSAIVSACLLLLIFLSPALADTSESPSDSVSDSVSGQDGGLAESKNGSEVIKCAVLLHGLARTSGSMNKLGIALNTAGWSTANVDYPSREFPIAVLAPAAVGEGVAACQRLGATRIDAVTHSLGGILMRQYFNKD